MPTANESLRDALIRHQIYLMRLSGSIRNKLFAVLDETEAAIREKILNTYDLTQVGESRLAALISSIEDIRAKGWNKYKSELLASFDELAQKEPGFYNAMVLAASPVILDTVLPDASRVISIARQNPFEGRTIEQWAEHVKQEDLRRIRAQVRYAVAAGETNQNLVSRIIGTTSLRNRDGVTNVTRNQVAAIARTTTNNVANLARAEFLAANASIFAQEQYVSTLDSRTTLQCANLDGQIFASGEGPKPPLHWNCRSIRVAYFADDMILTRPARNFTQRQLYREFASANNLGRITNRSDIPFGLRGQYDTFARARMRELTGTIPTATNYQEWLTGQSARFQDDVLGPSRGRLFRRGGLTLSRFVNRNGDELTLSELATREREAFIAAGLDPDNL